MADLSYQHLTALDEADRPWRRVWACPATGLFVKTYAKRHNVGKFGSITWKITGSLCDANGDTVRDENGEPLVHETSHLFKVASDARVGPAGEGEAPPSFEEIAAKLAADFESNCRLVICRVEEAELTRRAAAAFGG